MATAAPTPAPVPTPEPVKAARVEIVQTGLLFTEVGQTRQLAARVFDDRGMVIDTPVRWSSTDEIDISVSNTGLATAQSDSGSTQIFAAAGDVQSPPLLAVVTAVPPDTVLVDDEQVVRGPVETDPDAEPRFDNTYTVILAGSDAPPLDSLLIGTGSIPVAGRVVNTELIDDGVLVTLALVPAPELFPELEINQVFDLKDVQPEIAPEIAAAYDITREGDLLVFTAREAIAKITPSGNSPVGTRAFESACAASITGVSNGGNAPLPLRLEVPPVFKFSLNPSLDLLYTRSRGLERLLVKGAPTFEGQVGIKLTVAFEGKITCKQELFAIPLPIGGPLAFLVGGIIPVGVGLEAGGKITVADLGISDKVEVKTTLEAGLVCAFGDCDFRADLGEFDVKNTPEVNLPGLDDLRVEPAVELFGYAEASIGNRFTRKLRFTALEGKFGAKLAGSFAPQITQILANTYKSDYKLSLAAGLKAGSGITGVLSLLGLSNITLAQLELTFDLAKSPSGTVTADRPDFRAGDEVNFSVELKPEDVNFLGLYNVDEILLVRNVFNEAQIVERRSLGEGQTTAVFRFEAPDSGNIDEFYAFTVTRALPLDLLSLEIDRARFGDGVAVLKREFYFTGASATVCPSFEPGSCSDRTSFEQNDFPAAAASDSSSYRSTRSASNGQAGAVADQSAEVPLDDAGLISRLAIACNHQASSQSSGVSSSATGTSVGVAVIEVPEGRPLAYVIDAPPPIGEASNLSVVMIARGDRLAAAESDTDDPEILATRQFNGEGGTFDGSVRLFSPGEFVPFGQNGPSEEELVFLAVRGAVEQTMGAAEGTLPSGTYTVSAGCVAVSTFGGDSNVDGLPAAVSQQTTLRLSMPEVVPVPKAVQASAGSARAGSRSAVLQSVLPALPPAIGTPAAPTETMDRLRREGLHALH